MSWVGWCSLDFYAFRMVFICTLNILQLLKTASARNVWCCS
jgi:hypothetical protein